MAIEAGSTSELAPNHPDRPEELIPPFPSVPDGPADVMPAHLVLAPNPRGLPADERVRLPPVILGCAPFGYGIYAPTDEVRSAMPLRLVRAALRAGITGFDTSPHYHPSETILGHALGAVRAEFPRASYALITKAGKYGARVRDHVYDPAVVVRSVERSLRRLQTDYLDVVYLHDVEFVASAPFPVPAGHHVDALQPASTASAAYHLDAPHVSLGAGDDAILSCFAALRGLQAAGKVRAIGLAAYPLPTLLRLSLLVLAATGRPVDIVQSYAHHTVLTPTLAPFLDALTGPAQVGQVVNAAPLAMGILTTSGGPDWHPARSADADAARLFAATREAVKLARERGTSLEDVAIGFGYRTLRQLDARPVPVVVGCTDLDQLRATLEAYTAVNGGEGEEAAKKRKAVEEEVGELFEQRGVRGWSWQSPGPAAFE
ncbi:hypothetical protein Q5752_003319 [Cryptotrichosporon argae]